MDIAGHILGVFGRRTMSGHLPQRTARGAATDGVVRPLQLPPLPASRGFEGHCAW
ncbi:MAG TPA: hypothetical protein VHS99_11140 [Chloroflexota bacterium]|nr:hypothetical protein [Chloroflexota bacterium]